MTYKQQFLNKIQSKEAIVAVIGLGYVGLPLALRFAEAQLKVIGIDIDSDKVQKLNQGCSYISHISAERIIACNESCLQVTTEFSQLAEVDAIIICVPSPLNKYREPDLSYIISTVTQALPYLRPGQLLSLESTTYPGTTEEELQTRLESQGFTMGEDLFLLYSPEREDPGNPNFHTATIPKLCGGVTPNCLQVGQALYQQAIDEVIPVSSAKVAEMAKLLENIHRAVNIGLMNEMKILADKMDIDIHEVIDAAATKPFGFVPYRPGPGIGGHCIPIDPFYLTWKAREYGLHTRFIELAGEINDCMPRWVTNKIIDALNQQGKPLKGSRILILGVAYKMNVDDVRESPSLALMKILDYNGVDLAYADSHVPHLRGVRGYDFDMTAVSLTEQTLSEYDCVVIATAHNSFNYELIKQASRLIIDTRGVYREAADNIVKA